MRAILAMLLLVFFAMPALAEEPPVANRFGAGIELQQVAHHKPAQIKQAHERIVSYAGDLVSRARAYMGTNPTGLRSLWCGRFMALVAPDAARKIKNPDFARDWAGLRHVPPQIGAIAVLARGNHGGHVGVVAGFDDNGNPIIVSGNHGHQVGEGVYSARRVIAYVAAS